MMGRHHALSGAVVWLAGCAAVGAPTYSSAVLLGAPLCAVAALLPDVDHEGSLVVRSLDPLTKLLCRLVRATCGHRGLTHTAVAALAVGTVVTLAVWLAAGWAWWWAGLAVGAGMLTHVLGDACTHTGVPLLWPLRVGGKRWQMVGLWRPLRFRTGGWVENAVVGPALCVAGLGVVWLLLVG